MRLSAARVLFADYRETATAPAGRKGCKNKQIRRKHWYCNNADNSTACHKITINIDYERTRKEVIRIKEHLAEV